MLVCTHAKSIKNILINSNGTVGLERYFPFLTVLYRYFLDEFRVLFFHKTIKKTTKTCFLKHNNDL